MAGAEILTSLRPIPRALEARLSFCLPELLLSSTLMIRHGLMGVDVAVRLAHLAITHTNRRTNFEGGGPEGSLYRNHYL